MKERKTSFIRDESGAISVDWVVLCAAVACLGCLAVLTASDATFGLADSIRSATSDAAVSTRDR